MANSLNGDPIFRLAVVGDIDRIVELNRQFHLDLDGFYWDTAKWIQSQVETGNYFVLMHLGKIIGALGFEINKSAKNFEIVTIAIDKQMHRGGLGKLAINYAKTIAQERGMRTITVSSFERYGLKDFYTKCGFELDSPVEGLLEGEVYLNFVTRI